MKRPWDPTTLTANFWDGPEPHPGDGLETSAGRRQDAALGEPLGERRPRRAAGERGAVRMSQDLLTARQAAAYLELRELSNNALRDWERGNYFYATAKAIRAALGEE